MTRYICRASKETAGEVADSVEETLSYCDFLSRHWTRICAIIVIERLNHEFWRRTRVAVCFPDGSLALMLVRARMGLVGGTQWGIKRI